MGQRYDLFLMLFKEHLPALYRHFEEQGVRPDLYFMEWCMTLFAKRLKLDVTGRVWDCYLIMGEAVVYRTAVAMLSVLQPKLLGAPFETILKVLRDEPQNITEQQLFSAMGPIKLSQAFKEKLAALQRIEG